MYLPLFVGVLCWSLFWYALLYALPSFANDKEERADCFDFIVYWMFCYRSAALPHGAVGWTAVCDCGFVRSYSLTL